MKFSIIPPCFNIYPKFYANKNCVIYALSEIGMGWVLVLRNELEVKEYE